MIRHILTFIANLGQDPPRRIPAVHKFRDVGEAAPGDFVGPSAGHLYYEIVVTRIHWVTFARRMANTIPGGLVLCYDPSPGKILYAVGRPAPAALAPIIKAAEDRQN